MKVFWRIFGIVCGVAILAFLVWLGVQLAEFIGWIK